MTSTPRLPAGLVRALARSEPTDAELNCMMELAVCRDARRVAVGHGNGPHVQCGHVMVEVVLLNRGERVVRLPSTMRCVVKHVVHVGDVPAYLGFHVELSSPRTCW
jgi:hypothetical protein